MTKLSNDREYRNLYEKANSTFKEAQRLLSHVNDARKKYGTSSKQYIQAKTKYDEANVSYKKAEAQRIKRLNELKKPKVTKPPVKTVTDKDILLYQLGQAEDAGNDAEIKRIKDLIDALSPTPTAPEGTTFTDEENVKNLIASSKISWDGQRNIILVTSPTEKDDKGNPLVGQRYLYYKPTEPRMAGNRPISGSDSGVRFGTTDAIRDEYEKQLIKLYGSKQGLINKLFEGGYLTTNKIAANQMSKAILGALEDAVADYTVKQIDDYKNHGIKEFQSMDNFLSTGKRGGKESKARTNTYTDTTIFDKTNSRELTKKLYQKLMGRDPNAEEIEDALKLIVPAQKANPDRVTSVYDFEGDLKSRSTVTGLNTEEFLLEQLSKKDEAKANLILSYYDLFKQAIGVN